MDNYRRIEIKICRMLIKIFLMFNYIVSFPQQLMVICSVMGHLCADIYENTRPNIRYKMIYNIILQSVEKLNDFRIDLSRMNLKSILNTKHRLK